mmetsp:Transcript_29665/g.86436  ORF Transcript_29665/g.86436 Transcript_29665/m.86436 type:complete len:231 (-) Transcript_29665:66-758(-)
MTIHPHEQLGHLERVQYFLAFRHPIMKHLLLVLTERFELGHEHQALSDIITNLPNLIPPLDNLASLDGGDVQFLHQYAGDGMALGLEEELVGLTARPEGHLCNGRWGGVPFQLVQMKGQFLLPPPSVIAVHLPKSLEDRTDLLLLRRPPLDHFAQLPFRLLPLPIDQRRLVGNVGQMTFQSFVLGLEGRQTRFGVLEPRLLLLAIRGRGGRRGGRFVRGGGVHGGREGRR